MSEITNIPQPEAAERPSLRDVAVDTGEYLGVYVFGMNKSMSDKDKDRLPALGALAEKYPVHSELIYTLDAHLKEASLVYSGYSNDHVPAPTDGEIMPVGVTPDEDGVIQKDKRPRAQLFTAVNLPLDYTFSSVRHPLARQLLQLLNIATALDYETVNQPAVRAARLKSNGERLVRILTEASPFDLMRIEYTRVLEAVFSKEIVLPELRMREGSSPVRIDHSSEDYEDGVNPDA